MAPTAAALGTADAPAAPAAPADIAAGAPTTIQMGPPPRAVVASMAERRRHWRRSPYGPASWSSWAFPKNSLRALLRANGLGSWRNDTTAAMAAWLVALLAATDTDLALPLGVH